MLPKNVTQLLTAHNGILHLCNRHAPTHFCLTPWADSPCFIRAPSSIHSISSNTCRRMLDKAHPHRWLVMGVVCLCQRLLVEAPRQVPYSLVDACRGGGGAAGVVQGFCGGCGCIAMLRGRVRRGCRSFLALRMGTTPCLQPGASREPVSIRV